MIQIYDYDIKKSGFLTFANKHNKKLPKKQLKRPYFFSEWAVNIHFKDRFLFASSRCSYSSRPTVKTIRTELGVITWGPNAA